MQEFLIETAKAFGFMRKPKPTAVAPVPPPEAPIPVVLTRDQMIEYVRQSFNRFAAKCEKHINLPQNFEWRNLVGSTALSWYYQDPILSGRSGASIFIDGPWGGPGTVHEKIELRFFYADQAYISNRGLLVTQRNRDQFSVMVVAKDQDTDFVYGWTLEELVQKAAPLVTGKLSVLAKLTRKSENAFCNFDGFGLS